MTDIVRHKDVRVFAGQSPGKVSSDASMFLKNKGGNTLRYIETWQVLPSSLTHHPNAPELEHWTLMVVRLD